MKHYSRAMLLILALVALLMWRRAHGEEGQETGSPKAAEAKAAESKSISWSRSYAEARDAASKNGKPLMIDFEAEWCGFCKKLDRETYTDERVIALVTENFVALKVDVDKEPDLGKKFNVEGLPTIVFVSPSGEELQRITGFRPPELFVKDVSKSAQASSALAKLKELAEKDLKDGEAQRAYARALFRAGNVEGAVKVLTSAREALPEESLSRAGVLLDLGDAHRASGKLADARAAYEKLFSLKKELSGETRTRAYLPFASTLVSLRDHDGAITLLDAYLASPPASSHDKLEALFLRAYSHAVKKNADKALADLKAVKEADPDGRWGSRATQIMELFETK